MVATVADRLGPPDVVVHNALADLGRLDWADIARQTETAAGGLVNLLAAARPGFAARGFGRVIAIGSNLVQNPVVPSHDYTAA